MTPERWQQIDKLFHEALAFDPNQRQGFLGTACADDDSLRIELELLISSHETAEDFIETPAGDVAAELLGAHQSTFAPGDQIANYQVVSQLGSGGMGEVYLAHDTRLNRKIALKLLPPHFTVNPDRVRRFEREARAASALNHPNIVTVYEIGQSDSARFIATEFVDGKTLRQLINEKPLSLRDALNVAIQVAGALTMAHAAGIVHRDIKPENIMVRSDGYVKILDFGLAKLTELQTTDTEKTPTLLQSNPGLVMGTVQYMSPEQARGKKVDVRTDIWSLGVVLYELLSGHVPFSGETASHVMVSLMENELTPLTGYANVPAELDRIVTKALRKRQKERYQTASDLGRDLKNLKQELLLETRLKGLLEAVPSQTEGTTKVDGKRVGLTSASATATSYVVPAHPTSNAEYFVSEAKHHKRGFSIAAATLTIVVVVVGYFYFAGKSRLVADTEVIDSVAVLPFINESGDPNAEYLSDGFSDSVISSISRVPNLRVISLSTVLRYKGQQIDPQAVGRELNVQAVLVGRMTQRGDTLAISAELVDVRDNRRLWGGQYNRKPSEILVVQEEIAREIADKLRLRLGGVEKQRLTKHSTESAEAYDAYLRGRFMLEKRTGPAISKSIEYLEQAIKLDPNYALAYATLSYAYWSLPIFDRNLTRDDLSHKAKAKAAAAKALEIDDTLAEAHTALGHVRQSEGDLAGAERAFKRGIELNPNSGFAHNIYSNYLKDMGRIDEAVAESKRAVELEPASVLYNRNVAVKLYFARRYDESIEQSRKTLELDPNMTTAYRWLARSYEQKKLYDQAVEAWLKTAEFGPEVEAEFRQAYATSGWKGFWRKSLDLKMQRAKQGRVSPDALAETYARLGELDQAFAWLEKANALEHIKSLDPFWDDFRSDPRYSVLLRRMNVKP